MGKFSSKRSLLAGIFVCALLATGCANDGKPETWEDQDGLVVRNFVEACQESMQTCQHLKLKVTANVSLNVFKM